MIINWTDKAIQLCLKRIVFCKSETCYQELDSALNIVSFTSRRKGLFAHVEMLDANGKNYEYDIKW